MEWLILYNATLFMLKLVITSEVNKNKNKYQPEIKAICLKLLFI